MGTSGMGVGCGRLSSMVVLGVDGGVMNLGVVGGVMNLQDVVVVVEERSNNVTMCNIGIVLHNAQRYLHLVTLLIFTCKITCRCSHVKSHSAFVYNLHLSYLVWPCFR
jgi:DhnA family fructose-bisphosphate aldolase class Ia